MGIVLCTCVPVQAQEAIVLVYHRFGEDDIPSTNIKIQQFEAQLDWLVAQGAHFPSLDDLSDALRENRPLPRFSVIFTVDDAYASAATQAWPRLRARHIPLAVFVASEPVDQNLQGYMRWADIRRLRDEGVTIGLHSHRHDHMASLNARQIEDDFTVALGRFTDELGARPNYFAYPYGEFSQNLRDAVEAKGFKAAFAQFSSVVSEVSDRYALPRFAINETYGENMRFHLIAQARAMPLSAFSPQDPLVRRTDNPPGVDLIFAEHAQHWRTMRCFPSHIDGQAPIKIDGQKASVNLLKPLPVGRSRLNCTYQADGEWHWFGMPFFVSGDAPF